MNVDNLTDKQKANRAYYHQNAEQIKAQKRAAYKNKTGAKVKKKAKTIIVSDDNIARMTVRRRIEDFKTCQRAGN